MKDYQKFLNSIQRRGSNPHHIRHCLGSRDAWKWVRKNKWKALGGSPCDPGLYSRTVNAVNVILADRLLEGHTVTFPYRMGSLCLSSVEAKAAIEGGKIRTNYRTDWEKTLRHWFEDRDALERHYRIKRVQKRIYFVRYSKKGARYMNMRFYKFRLNRSLSRAIGKTAEAGRVKSEEL